VGHGIIASFLFPEFATALSPTFYQLRALCEAAAVKGKAAIFVT